MSSEVESPVQTAVRFSRTLSLRWLVALGASVSVGLGIFILLGQIITVTGRHALEMPYILLAAVSLPLILTYVERVAVMQGSGGALNLARRSRFVGLVYASGWLLLGGYATLIALLGWGVALHLNLLTLYFFDLSLDLSPLAIAVIALVALNNILRVSWSWRSRSTYVYLSIIVLFLVILRDLLRPAPVETSVTWIHGSTRMMGITALMVASLWGLQFILNVRDEVQRPTRTLLPAMLLTVGLVSGLGVLAALAIVNYGALPQTLYPLVEMTLGMTLIPQVLIVILYAVFGFLICLIALNQAVVHGLRLMGDMSRDGFLPERAQAVSGRYQVSLVSLVLLTVLSSLLVQLLPALTLVGLASLAFLWVTALVHLPDALRSRPNLPERRFPKLPFHPLFPWLTIVIAAILAMNLPVELWWRGGAWVLIGAGYYFLYARRRGLAVHRQEVVIGEVAEVPAEETADEYVVLVGIANPKTAPSLLRAGARLAQARQGTLLALKVITLAEQMPAHLKRQAAEREWQSLAELVQPVDLVEVTAKPLVRLAPSPTAGILEAVNEEGVDLLLLGWEGARPPDDPNWESILDPLVSRAPCDVAVLRGALPPAVKRVLVPTAGGPHAPVALGLGQDLTEPDDRQIMVEHMVVEYLTPELETTAQSNLQSTLGAVKDGQQVENRIVEVDAVKEGILAEADRMDLLLLGASKQGFLEKSFFGGLPAEVATAFPGPIILARAREPAGRLGLRRLAAAVSDALPTLTLDRQAEVFQEMREAAQPSVDFFVLITLAAVIASLGLLQNSAAVIIGAMLVAPLMSPILAMAMSLVHGDLRLLVVAAEATTKGIALAIAVGIVVVIISPLDQATTEILARTQPNVLDLMVALASGAAAGYALSRKEVAAALPGVAIAAALVPPLCVVGYGIGTSQLNIAAGAMLLFITNLIAIVLAASLTFVALGFHPPRRERGELVRGLQVTLISLAIVSIVLSIATISTVTQLNRQLRVEEVFKQEMVSEAARVVEMKITPRRNGFNIEATVVNFVESTLTPEELTQLEQDLSEAVRGPVTVNLTMLPAERGQLAGANRMTMLVEQFKLEIEARTAQVDKINIEDTDDGFVIEAIVISYDQDELTDAALSEIQANLIENVNAPVDLEVMIVQGRRSEVEAPDPPPESEQN